MKRIHLLGAAIGAVFGALFALAVVSFADCAGPNCASERVIGVLGHATVGAATGVLLAGLASLVVRTGRTHSDSTPEAKPPVEAATPSTSWEGFGSLESAVAGLRRGRFRIRDTFPVTGRGLVLAGEIVEGEVRPGMVLLPRLVQHPNVYYALPILAVEAVTHPGGIDEISLVVQEGGAPGSVTAPAIAPGTLLDVLERAPAA